MVSHIDGVVALLRRVFHTQVMTMAVVEYWSESDMKWKVERPLIKDPPVSLKISMSMNRSKSWWETCGVDNPREAPIFLT